MKIGNFYFLPKPIPTVVALLFLALFIWAGFWQLGRAEKKFSDRAERSQNEKKGTVVVAADMQGTKNWINRRGTVTGEFVPNHDALLANVKYQDEPGFLVITPLRIQGSNTYILVVRGWLAHKSGDFRVLPKIPAAPVGVLTFHGLIDSKPAVGIEAKAPDLGYPNWPKLITYVKYPWYEKQLKAKVLPFVLKDLDSRYVGLVRDWHAFAKLRERMPPERNFGYAVQWWAMATVLVVVFFVVTIKRRDSNILEG